MNNLFKTFFVCSFLLWSTAQPSTAQKTVHAISGGVALTAGASAVVTGLGWLYSALMQRGVTADKLNQAHAITLKRYATEQWPQVLERQKRGDKRIAPRAVISASGPVKVATSDTPDTPKEKISWWARWFLQPTQPKTTKAWRTAFLTSLAFALSGGTVWQLTKEKPDTPKPGDTPPAPTVLPPPLPFQPNSPLTLQEVNHGEVLGIDSDQVAAQKTIAQAWRERKQLRQAQQMRQEGARLARREMQQLREHDGRESVARELVGSMVSAATLGVAQRATDQAGMCAEDAEAQLQRQQEAHNAQLRQQSVRRQRARVAGFRRGQNNVRSELMPELTAKRQRVWHLEKEARDKDVQHNEFRGLAAADAESHLLRQGQRNDEHLRAAVARERQVRDDMVASAVERATAAAHSATRQRLKDLSEELEVARRTQHADGVVRADQTRHIKSLQQMIEATRAEGDSIAEQLRRKNAALAEQLRKEQEAREAELARRLAAAKPPATPAPATSGPRPAPPTVAPPKRVSLPAVPLIDMDSNEEDDDSDEVVVETRRLPRQKKSFERVGNFTTLEPAKKELKQGRRIKVKVKRTGKWEQRGVVIRSGVDPRLGSYVETDQGRIYDTDFGFDTGESPKYGSPPKYKYDGIQVLRVLKGTKPPRRPRSAAAAPRATAGASARVKGRQRTRIGKHFVSPAMGSTQPGSGYSTLTPRLSGPDFTGRPASAGDTRSLIHGWSGDVLSPHDA